ncbi:hypothetical protein SAMN05421820_105110 [Pedobacter steynii]|uniref:YD repeat-containing protein n=1 Tax=Pedobacter steynii TaxID=430522 RepID=A0A1G9WAA5_9SPHI|nr:hypothetical protein [Pedobacter steynii]NQX40227.1 hypothetical protein [Pedobacter steynii]SDM81389.1 hypothetical protein SAMN05421820_105110 [Pedobacter steynii]
MIKTSNLNEAIVKVIRKMQTLAVISILICPNVLAQKKPPVSFPTPNAASLGTYGQIPVNYFNGLASVSIPIHTIDDKGISIPIELSYQALGVRTDNHPGWVGLNWNLTAGGMITRIANGDADEIIVSTADAANPNTKSYLFNYGLLSDDNNWSTASVLGPIIQNYVTFPPSDLSASPSPDEFVFNFNGLSGSFFLDHQGQWKVRSSNAKGTKISMTTNSFDLEGSQGFQSIPLARIIDKIELTTPDGVVYVFGGTAESIEFSRNEGRRDETYNSVTATSWMLTKVIPQSGTETILNYERGGYTIISSDSWSSYYYANYGNHSSSTGSPKIVHTLLNPVYLKEIVTPGQTVTFTRSQTNELAHRDSSPFYFNNPGAPPTFYQDIGNEGSKWYKLINISVKDNFTEKLIKQFDFTYKDQLDSRLMLTSVQEKDATRIKSKNPYEFYYYDSEYFDLPGYASMKTDHWGFFNNYNYFDHVDNSKISPADINAYTTSRDANAEFLLEGTLSHVFYPTGGQTEFVYEPNDYSSIINSYDTTPNFSLTSLGFGQKKIAGGLRIKKIISKTGDAIPNIREFSYVKSSASFPTTSSGILGGKPTYFEQLYPVSSMCVGNAGLNVPCAGATGSYWLFSNRTAFPLSFTNGNHVTYSEIKEKFPDGSYKIYNYSNHDSILYRNTAIINSGYYHMASFTNIKTTDMSYVRGKLLTERSYTSVNKLLSTNAYEYNKNPDRFNDHVRVVDITATSANEPIGAQIHAYKKFLFEPYIIKTTVTNYNQNDNSSLSSVKTFEYNDLTNLLKNEVLEKSDGKELKTIYKYPSDKSSLSNTFSSSDLLVIDEMVGKNMISSVLEVETYVNSTFLKRESTIYKKHTFGGNHLFLPEILKSRYAGVNLDNLDAQYHKYDNEGNVLTYSSNNSSKTSFAWGYNQQYPIAKVLNSEYNEFFYEGFEGRLSGSVGEAHTGEKRHLGSYTVPFVRPNTKSYVLAYWEYIGTKWKYQLEDYTIDNKVISSVGPIDDVSVYPKDALFSSYTYKPLIGMSSETNPSGSTKFYAFNSLAQLSDIKDNSKNIIANYNYNYANTAGNWQNTANTICETVNDLEYNNYLGTTGNKLQEQIDNNPFSFTYNKTRFVVSDFNQNACPPSYYFVYSTDPSLTSVSISAKRSYSDNTSKTMRFKIRYDSISNGQQVEQYVNIPITGTTGSTSLQVQAGSYIEVEHIETY